MIWICLIVIYISILLLNLLPNKEEPYPLNCPKCGGQPCIKIVGDWKNYCTIECGHCNYSPFKDKKVFISINGAIKEWNRRVK